jgi:hypothetical protein
MGFVWDKNPDGGSRMKISVFWAWYDLWVGAYWDRKNRDLYVCLIPTLVIKLAFGPPK